MVKTKRERKLEKEIENIYSVLERMDKRISTRTKPTISTRTKPTISTRYVGIPSKSPVDHYKQRLAGNLPYVLLDKGYFPTNDLLVKFALKNLKLDIKFAKSKSRDALIGSIIVEVVKKNPDEIRKFYRAFQRIIGRGETVGIKDFFGEWNKIIKQL